VGSIWDKDLVARLRDRSGSRSSGADVPKDFYVDTAYLDQLLQGAIRFDAPNGPIIVMPVM